MSIKRVIRLNDNSLVKIKENNKKKEDENKSLNQIINKYQVHVLVNGEKDYRYFLKNVSNKQIHNLSFYPIISEHDIIYLMDNNHHTFYIYSLTDNLQNFWKEFVEASKMYDWYIITSIEDLKKWNEKIGDDRDRKYGNGIYNTAII